MGLNRIKRVQPIGDPELTERRQLEGLRAFSGREAFMRRSPLEK
jgi:hypothetical protein